MTGSPNADDEFYTKVNGPSTFGNATRTLADSGTGDTVGVVGDKGLFLPSTYVSGSQLTSSSTWNGSTFASLGVTAGTYTWTWGDGATADSFTLQVGAPPNPPIVVDEVSDVDDGNLSVGHVSLREAIALAETQDGADTITFDPTVFGTAQTITLTKTLPTIYSDLTITGPGANLLTVDANFVRSLIIFKIEDGTTTISGLTVSNANSRGYAILIDTADATVTLDHCQFVNNYYGISNYGTLIATHCTITGGSNSYYGFAQNGLSATLTNCTIDDQGEGYGYGIDHEAGTLDLINCLVRGSGEGIYAGYPLTAVNSTFTGASSYAIEASSDLTLTNCTISGNDTGLYSYDGTATLANTIVANNGYDYIDVFNDLGHNLLTYIRDDLDPKLEPLANNGGPTLTMALQADSPAIDAGDPASTLTEDQRGYGRPVDGPDADTIKTIDIGAFEFGAFPPGTIVVNSIADPGDGTADPLGTGDGTTLREAIAAANTEAGANIIIFDPTVFATAQTITLISGDLLITGDTTITAPAAGVTVSGNNASRVFTISGTTVSMRGLTITGGNGGSSVANGRAGGILHNGGDLTLLNCTITNSTAPGTGDFGSNGGGIANTSGTLNLTGCTIANNTANELSGGGGIANLGATLVMTNCTVSGNHAGRGSYNGGGVWNGQGAATISNCTIAGNTASGFRSGGGIHKEFGAVTVSNTIIAGNSGSNGAAADLASDGTFAMFTSNGYNLIGDGTGATGFIHGTNGDQVGTTNAKIDPKLYALDDNGGPTRTMEPQADSPAIDAGDPAGTLATDQRGYIRPADGPDADHTKTRDVGAVEFNASTPGNYVVDSTGDTVADDDLTTLREAILAANGDGMQSAITFDPTVFATAQTITLGGTELPIISTSMTITGPGAGVTVDGDHTSRIIEVTGGTVAISRLTITKGYTNDSNGYSGGGISQTGGSLTLTNCSVTNNTTDFGAAGIYQDAGTLIMNGCTVSDNHVTNSSYAGGGGILGGAATLTNCTIANNIGGSGGGFNAGDGVTFTNCTISGNQAITTDARYGGGGLRGGAFILNNCIVAGNTAPNTGTCPDIQGYAPIAGNYNLVQNTNGATLTGTNNITGQDALLDGLQNNGGLTQTMALQTSPSVSPAIDAGDPASTLAEDQRRYGRPVDGPDGDTTATIDIGAFEFGAGAEMTTPETTITKFKPPTSPTIIQSATITFSGSDNLTAANELIFEGRLDSAAFAPVTSPVSVINVPEGSHTYEVRARDEAGNVDPTPAFSTWIVDRTAPTITTPGDIEVQTANPNGTGVIFNVSASDTVDTTPTVTANPANGSNFPIGTTTVTVTATDDAGNQSTATFDVTVTLRRGTELIAAKGQHVEGEPTGTNYFSFGVPSINADGTVACTVRMKVGTKFVPAIVVGNPPTVFVRAGDEASGTDSKFVKFDDVLLNQNGQIAFTAKVSGKGTTDAGLWTNALKSNSRGPRLRLVAREKDEAPGVSGATFSTFTSVALGDDLVAFTATLRGVGGKSNNGLWIDAGSGLTLAIHDSGPLTVGHETKTVKSFVALSALAGAGGQGNGVVLGEGDTSSLSVLPSGDRGQVIARVECTDGSRVVIVVRADGNIEHIAAKGETAPDSDGAKFSSFSEQTQSTDGRAAFIATLTSGENAIFAESESVNTLASNLAFVPAFELRRIVAEGDSARGVEGAHYSILHNPVNNDQGDVAWIASLAGVRAQTASGIWWDRHGRTFLVAREGDKAPGANGAFHQFKSLALSSGPDGAPLFTARLRNSAHIGLWAVDAAGDLRLLMQEGASIDVGGTMHKVKTITVLSLVRPSKAQTRSYAGGAVILRVTFTGAEGQALITVPVPEPAVP